MSVDAAVHNGWIAVVIGIIFGILWYVVGQLALEPPIVKIVRMVLLLLGAMVLIGFLMALIGHPIVR